MKNPLVQQVRQVPVTDPLAAARRYDYADAFELRLPGPDPYPPETWIRAGLAATPKWVDHIISLLGWSEAPGSSAGHLSGFQIVESSPEVIQLETSLPLLHVVMVGRNLEPARRMLTTAVRFERPVIARLVFAFVGIGHRRAARQVIAGKVSTR